MSDGASSYAAYIRATPEQLWTAITTPAWTRRYLDFMEGFMEVESAWAPGAPVQYRTGGVIQIEGEVLDVSPPTRLVTTVHLLYDEERKREPSTRLSWVIEPMGEVCKLSVHHDEAADSPHTAEDVAICIPSILSNLRIVLETGKPRLIKEIVFDCADPARLSTFWAAAMGYVFQGPLPAPGDPFIATADPRGVGPELAFVRVPEPKTAKNRLHFDLRVDDPAAEVLRLLSLGASRSPGYPEGEDGAVLLDPEGNEFCVRG